MRSRVAQRRSTIYLLAELDPPELAFFDAQEIRVADVEGPRVEVLGHGIAYWRADVATRDAWRAVVDGERLLRLATNAYALLGGRAFSVRVRNWVEARHIVSYSTMIGIRSPRFGNVALWPQDDPANVRMREAVVVAAGADAATGLHRAALRDFHASLLEEGPDTFLYAYRAIEAIRVAVAGEEMKLEAQWQTMHETLETDAQPSKDLAELSKLVRHGRGDSRVVTKALALHERQRHRETARTIILKEVERIVGRSLALLPQDADA